MIEQIQSAFPNAEIKHFRKGEVLQRAGEVSTKVYCVKKGLLRSYSIDEKGKEHVFMFGSEGWIMSDVQSHVFKDEAVLYIDCLEASEVIILEGEALENQALMADDVAPMFTTLFKRMAVMQRRILGLMSSSARERYESFLNVYPELPNRVSQRMIASYLGITPEALSTIRRKMVKST